MMDLPGTRGLKAQAAASTLRGPPSAVLLRRTGAATEDGSTLGSAATEDGFTLVEVVISVFIMMLLFAAIFTAYIQSSYRAEWTGYSLAAQALAVRQLEAAKAAVWDPLQTPVKDEIYSLKTNNNGITWALMDLPVSGSNYVYATNYISVTLIPNGIYSNYMVKVDTVWPFRWRSQTIYFTNTVADYYAPD